MKPSFRVKGQGILVMLVVLAFGLMATPFAQALPVNLVLNGGFDLDSPPPQTAPLDWTLTPALSGSDFFVGPGPTFGALSPPNSSNFGAVGSFDDTLSQVITDTPGVSYTLTYWLAHNSTDSENDFSASWNGVTIPGSVLVNAASFNYTEFTFTLVGTGSDTLAFAGREVPAWYDLDNVSLTSSIPEPGTLVLLGSAMVGLAGIVRRKLML